MPFIEQIEQHAGPLFWACSGGCLLAVLLFDRTALKSPNRARWLVNLALFFLGFAVARLSPRAPEGAQDVLAFVAGVLALDLFAYLRHRVYHRLPVAWRFHQIHHQDTEVDWSTNVRFHPVESLFAALTNAAFAWALSLPAAALFTYATLVVSVGWFQHTTLRWPGWLEWVLIIPLRHRQHHSAIMGAGGNYGVVFPWWDRLLGTWQAQAAPLDPMGLGGQNDPSWNLTDSLIRPFTKSASPLK